MDPQGQKTILRTFQDSSTFNCSFSTPGNTTIVVTAQNQFSVQSFASIQIQVLETAIANVTQVFESLQISVSTAIASQNVEQAFLGMQVASQLLASYQLNISNTFVQEKQENLLKILSNISLIKEATSQNFALMQVQTLGSVIDIAKNIQVSNLIASEIGIQVANAAVSKIELNSNEILQPLVSVSVVEALNSLIPSNIRFNRIHF